MNKIGRKEALECKLVFMVISIVGSTNLGKVWGNISPQMPDAEV